MTIFWGGGTIIIANIHTSIGWPLTITPYPVSTGIATFLLTLICSIFLQQQVLLLAWSTYSAKVALFSYTCITASPPNPCMHLCALEIEVHVALWRIVTSRVQQSFWTSWKHRSLNFSRVGTNLGRHIWELLVVLLSPSGHSVALFPNRVLYSHAGPVGTAEDLSSQMTKSKYHVIRQVIQITCKVTW